MDNNAIFNIPKCIDGTFYTILDSDEIINVNSNVKAKCIICEEEKKRIISGAILVICFYPTFKLLWLLEIISDQEKKELKIYVLIK